MTGRLYLLDTSIVLALVRGRALAEYIDERFALRESKIRHFVSIVTHGEIRVLAIRRGWGTAKTEALRNALDNLVTVDVNHPNVLDSYVQIDVYSQQHPDGARNMGKNDLWIAACAKAASATLLTTDHDFAHLSPGLLDVEIISPDTGRDAG